MDKKKYESYDEIHKKLQEAMQEAALSDEAGPYMDPSEDLSFMEEKSADTNEKKKFVISRFGKVAAVIIIVLLGMNVIMLATDSCVSYGDKGLLHRIYEGARGIFTDDEGDKFVKQDETGQEFVITDLKYIDEAKQFWPDLYVPLYIPEIYKLNVLNISCGNDGEYIAEYFFNNNDNYIRIINYNTEDNNFKNVSNDNGEVMEYSDRIIHIYSNKSNNNLISDIYFDNSFISVCGDLPKDELLKISINLSL